jgi:hypothetical protein
MKGSETVRARRANTIIDMIDQFFNVHRTQG